MHNLSATTDPTSEKALLKLLTFASTKTVDDSERQLVHERADAFVFIVSICCLWIAGTGNFRPFLLRVEPARHCCDARLQVRLKYRSKTTSDLGTVVVIKLRRTSALNF